MKFKVIDKKLPPGYEPRPQLDYADYDAGLRQNTRLSLKSLFLFFFSVTAFFRRLGSRVEVDLSRGGEKNNLRAYNQRCVNQKKLSSVLLRFDCKAKPNEPTKGERLENCFLYYI